MWIYEREKKNLWSEHVFLPTSKWRRRWWFLFFRCICIIAFSFDLIHKCMRERIIIICIEQCSIFFILYFFLCFSINSSLSLSCCLSFLHVAFILSSSVSLSFCFSFLSIATECLRLPSFIVRFKGSKNNNKPSNEPISVSFSLSLWWTIDGSGPVRSDSLPHIEHSFFFSFCSFSSFNSFILLFDIFAFPSFCTTAPVAIRMHVQCACIYMYINDEVPCFFTFFCFCFGATEKRVHIVMIYKNNNNANIIAMYIFDLNETFHAHTKTHIPSLFLSLCSVGNLQWHWSIFLGHFIKQTSNIDRK